jgi:hypothetical protein
VKYLLMLLLLAGCSAKTYQSPSIMTGTHQVWFNDTLLQYENDRGFGCGEIDKVSTYPTYEARVINWNTNGKDETFADVITHWNSFSDAESFVEKWCKP